MRKQVKNQENLWRLQMDIKFVHWHSVASSELTVYHIRFEENHTHA